jgi:hypothetical protein
VIIPFVVPEGEEGWLCPACDCKIDCIELINELQGTDLDINDSWEVTISLLRILAVLRPMNLKYIPP